MISVTLSHAQFARYMERLGKSYMPTVKRGLVAGAARCVPLMVRRTDTAPKASPNGRPGAVSNGDYRRAWKSSSTPNGSRVFNQQPYAGVIDYGRRPGGPVSAQGRRAIARWAHLKLGVSEKEAKSAAFLIARAITKRGLLPRKVMSGATDKMTKLVNEEVEYELAKELAKVGT